MLAKYFLCWYLLNLQNLLRQLRHLESTVPLYWSDSLLFFQSPRCFKTCRYYLFMFLFVFILFFELELFQFIGNSLVFKTWFFALGSFYMKDGFSKFLICSCGNFLFSFSIWPLCPRGLVPGSSKIFYKLVSKLTRQLFPDGTIIFF